MISKDDDAITKQRPKFASVGGKIIPKVYIRKRKTTNNNTLDACHTVAPAIKRDDIHHYVINDDVNKMKKCLLDHSECCNIVNMKNEQSMTPLQMAIQYQASSELIMLLLENGADVLMRDNFDTNSLEYAVSQDSSTYLELIFNFIYSYAIENLKLFLMRGYVKSKPEYTQPLNEIFQVILTNYNSNGDTLITKCILEKKFLHLIFIFEIVPKEVKTTVVNFSNPLNGKTILYICLEIVVAGHDAEDLKSMASLLLRNEADPRIKNYAGYNCFDLCRRTNPNALSLLKDEL